MVGGSGDVGHTLRSLNRYRQDTYEGLNRFRLQMTDADGQEWQGGWTVPEINFSCEPWVISGTCKVLSTQVTAEDPEPAGAEVRFLIPKDHPAFIVLGRFVRTTNAEGRSISQRTLEVRDSNVRFSFDGDASVLTLTAASTPQLPAHYAENWLGEPLRILFGQLVYPRLVERRFPDGKAMLSVRPSPRWIEASNWTALWVGEKQYTDDVGFFEMYVGLLSLISQSGEWESHTVTSFYEEVIQAARGSRWVWILTLASSIEGMTRLLVPASELRSDADAAALAELAAHIAAWKGKQRLKDAAISSVRRLDTVSVIRALLGLVDTGIGTRKQVDSWKKVRNRAMHGELISRYSSREDDQVLLDMADLLRALTTALARRGA
jgi:hypothetical protein